MKTGFLKISMVGILIALLGFSPRSAFAADVSVESNVNTTQAVLGSPIQLDITVRGTQDIDHIELPDLTDFNARYVGPSTSVTIINGKMDSSKTFVYSLLPLKVGHFTIPGVNVTIDGQNYQTQAIEIDVSADADAAPVDSDSAHNQANSLNDKIFIALKVPKNEFYLNEPVPIKVFLFINELSVRDIQFPKIQGDGFTLGKYDQPRQYQQVVQGIRYSIVEFSAVLYPLREGPLALGPAAIGCSIVTSSGNSPLTSRNMLFDDDFFNSLLNQYEKTPYTVTSETVDLTVLPLPEDNKPAGFSSAVGQFTFDVTASPTTVKEGDPITLRMEIKGHGNFSAVKFPQLDEGSQFKTYEPNIKEDNGVKKLEQVIIPLDPSLKEIPAFSFSYFDVNLKRYETITQGPIPITVQPLQKGEQPHVVGLSTDEPKPVQKKEEIGQDIIFVKETSDPFRRRDVRIYERLSFQLGVFLGLLALIALTLLTRHHERLKTDSVYAGKLLAPKAAKKQLEEAKKSLSAGKPQEFYDRLHETLQQYLGHKLNLNVSSLTFEAVREPLEKICPDKNIIEATKNIFDACDSVRYSTRVSSAEEMTLHLQTVEKVIDFLERSIK